MALRQLIRARTGALQTVQHSQRAQLFAKVIDQCADIGALADLAPQRALLGILIEVEQVHFVHNDIARRTLHLPALAGQIVQLLAVHLDRRIHGRHLLLRTDKAPHHLLYRVFRGIAFAGLEHFAGDILRIRAVAEREPCNVFLILRCGKICCLGRTADEYRQNTGRHRIECAAVTDPARVQNTAQLGNHIVRGKALRLVHQQDAVQVTLLHETAPLPPSA